MAGAGFKSWVDGDVLSAADVNTYLMQQAVMVFADSSARSTAITAPSEGMVTYLTGTDVIEYYDGAAWQPILDQDVIDAKGDLIVGTADDTVGRLAVGTNGYVLTADSAETTGLKWAPGGSTFIGCAVYINDVTTSITSGIPNTLSYTSEDYDTDAFHDNSTNPSRITIPAGLGGKYLVNLLFSAPYDTLSTYWILFLKINGSAPTADGIFQGQIGRDENTGTTAVPNVSIVLDLAAGDYIETQIQSAWGTGNKRLFARLSASYLGA